MRGIGDSRHSRAPFERPEWETQTSAIHLIA
jgi:hypothetical protein